MPLKPLDMSVIREITQQVDKQTNVILSLLNYDDLQYYEIQYRRGCEYLQLYIPNNPAGIDELLGHRFYWSWWKNRWHQRDHAYLVNMALHLAVLSTDDLRAIYDMYHDVCILAREIAPSSVIMSITNNKNVHKAMKVKVA
jgi:hypothetical protein